MSVYTSVTFYSLHRACLKTGTFTFSSVKHSLIVIIFGTQHSKET